MQTLHAVLPFQRKLSGFEIEFLRISLEGQLHEGDVKIIEYQVPKPRYRPRYRWKILEHIKYLLFKSVPRESEPREPDGPTLYKIVWEPTKGEFLNLTFEPMFNSNDFLLNRSYIRESVEIWAAKLKRAREMNHNNGT